jgi:hypothetical protein
MLRKVIAKKCEGLSEVKLGIVRQFAALRDEYTKTIKSLG